MLDESPNNVCWRNAHAASISFGWSQCYNVGWRSAIRQAAYVGEYGDNQYPQAEGWATQVISLPFSPTISRQQQQRVAEVL
jgi:dTDP-4-amino-4,6-dideoxygalactose transaminase